MGLTSFVVLAIAVFIVVTFFKGVRVVPQGELDRRAFRPLHPHPVAWLHFLVPYMQSVGRR
jgi:regulator of protease activity HflC (stomatin/prohibitin superfamily)